jgi:hypothetical protein
MKRALEEDRQINVQSWSLSYRACIIEHSSKRLPERAYQDTAPDD